MGNIEITTKLSRLRSVSSIDDDYLKAATGGALKKFVIFTEKHLFWSPFLIKLQACKFIEKRLQHQCFPLCVRKFLKVHILKNVSEWLLLIHRISIYNYNKKLIFRELIFFGLLWQNVFFFHIWTLQATLTEKKYLCISKWNNISNNSQNIWRHKSFSKRDSNKGVLLKTLWSFHNAFHIEHPRKGDYIITIT